MSSLQSRLLVSVIGVPVLVWVVLWAPPIVLLIAVALLAGLGAVELQQCVGGVKWNELVFISAVVAAFTVALYYVCPEYVALFAIAQVLPIFGIAIGKGGEVKFCQIMAASFGSFAIGYSFAAFVRLVTAGCPRAYLLLPFILSFACDTFAYFAGRAFGKHKLAPKVSPKKTIEGSIGGILGNVVCGLLFIFVMDHWFGGSMIDYMTVGILAFACSIFAQIGDLSFSLIKREFGVKDYGRLFLEHGGVLDRFDSVLFVTPVIEIVLNIVQKGHL